MRWRKEKSVLLLEAELRFLGRQLVKILSSSFSSDGNFTITEIPIGGRGKSCIQEGVTLGVTDFPHISAREVGRFWWNLTKKRGGRRGDRGVGCAKFRTAFNCSLVTAVKLKAGEFFSRPLQILKSLFHIIDTQRHKFLRWDRHECRYHSTVTMGINKNKKKSCYCPSHEDIGWARRCTSTHF